MVVRKKLHVQIPNISFQCYGRTIELNRFGSNYGIIGSKVPLGAQHIKEASATMELRSKFQDIPKAKAECGYDIVTFSGKGWGAFEVPTNSEMFLWNGFYQRMSRIQAGFPKAACGLVIQENKVKYSILRKIENTHLNHFFVEECRTLLKSQSVTMRLGGAQAYSAYHGFGINLESLEVFSDFLDDRNECEFAETIRQDIKPLLKNHD